MIDRKIVLLSKSPRRSQLLREAGFNFEVKTKDVDESYPDTLETGKIAEYISQKKAAAGDEYISNNNCLLTADTIVVFNDKVYEKPVDKSDAIRILKTLSGQTHTVITGVTIRDHEKQISFSDHSNVTFDKLSDEEIEYYLETCKPYDKAGAYGIQEWIGHCKILKMEGSYTNIMGLPVYRVYEVLRDW